MELDEIVANAQDNETCLWNLVNGDGDGNDGNSGDCHGRETCLSSMAASEIWSTILKPRGANQEAAYWTPVFTLLAPLPGKTNQFPQVTTNSTKHGKKRIELLSLLWFLRYLKRKTYLFQTKTKKTKEKAVCFKQRKKQKLIIWCWSMIQLGDYAGWDSIFFQLTKKISTHQTFVQLTKHFCNSQNIFSTHQTFFQLAKHFSTHQTSLARPWTRRWFFSGNQGRRTSTSHKDHLQRCVIISWLNWGIYTFDFEKKLVPDKCEDVISISAWSESPEMGNLYR